ncbi:GvpL/GvpF family gas vesicle protein [Marinisporobacter balticus]|uniref:Gas vesicle protein GvpL/GvpF n=1 Tax=Marinisporobacter balticus TaxID=2018667 RepID=A0A4R2KWX7_9FIRM|nr:GvpL/GvpF family gas vesicle protein [Marinisporobacter balticus]TCO77367.1 gas vesicle protein GvpL/GvpF [Marinisporobacter balticus]
MEYLYLAMFIQEIGRSVNEENIRKIFNALDIEVNDDKVRLLIPALSILASGNIKNVKRETKSSSLQKLTHLQKQFEVLENTIKKVDERAERFEQEQQTVSLDIEKVKEAVEVESKEIDTMNRVTYSGESKRARYIYGVADNGVRDHLGAIGLEGEEVYTIPYKEMCVIVHNCSAEPYKSDNDDVVKEWLFTQQEVLDVVAENFGVVLPMGFDMIIEEKIGMDVEQVVKDWLKENYDNFKEKMAKIRNKQEFGVQVILDTELLSQRLIETDEKLIAKKKEIDSKPQGIAYLEREMMKELIKEKIEEKADEYFREFYNMIKKCTDDIVIGKTKKVGGNQQMLMNLSCLVYKDRVTELGKELEKIENKDGILVRFSGPWAPFSFVTPERG